MYIVLFNSQLQCSILFCSKGSLADAGKGYNKKRGKKSSVQSFCSEDNKSIQVISSISSFLKQRHRAKAKKKRALTLFLTSVIFFSSCCKTTRLQREFAYFCRLSQSRTKSVSRQLSAPGSGLTLSKLLTLQADQSLYIRQYVSDQRKTCLFDADRKRN